MNDSCMINQTNLQKFSSNKNKWNRFGGEESHLDILTLHSDCDFMLRHERETFVPIIFINKALPEILNCIAREFKSYRSDLFLAKKLFRQKPSLSGMPFFGGMSSFSLKSSIDEDLLDSSPLLNWYWSTLSNVYTDMPLDDWRPDKEDLKSMSFSLQSLIYAPVSFSSYQYVSLILPPLWHRDDETLTDPKALFIRQALCHVKYEKEAEIWYASLVLPDRALPCTKQRIPRRFASARDSFRI